MISNGYELHFTQSGAGIFRQNQLIHKGSLDPVSKLFTIDLLDLVPRVPDIPAPSCPQVNSTTKPFLSSRKVLEILWLHKRLGHPSRATMINAIQNNAWQNIPPTITPQDINIVFTHVQCTACALGKRNKLPVNVGSGISPTSPGHTISFDYQPVTTKSITGHTGYFLFKCLYSGFRYSAFVTSKSAASLISSLDSVRLFFLSHGYPIVKVRCDSGSSELSEEFSKYLLQHHITLDPAAVNSQFQNPVEREIQTVNKGVATLFADQHLLTPAFWPYAVQFWIHTANASPMSSDMSPLELVTNVVPDISTTFRFPFGCPVTSSKEGPKVALTHAKSEIGIALGTSSGSNK
jgi:hypothetical protein